MSAAQRALIARNTLFDYANTIVAETKNPHLLIASLVSDLMHLADEEHVVWEDIQRSAEAIYRFDDPTLIKRDWEAS